MQVTELARLKLKEVVENSIAGASPLRRVSTVEDIVPVLMFLASDDSRWVTGQSIHAEGGADGPTSIFVAGKIGTPWGLYIATVVVLSVTIVYFVKKYRR